MTERTQTLAEGPSEGRREQGYGKQSLGIRATPALLSWNGAGVGVAQSECLLMTVISEHIAL